MKSMNCISTTGRMPIIAAPIAAPTMADSEIGVSMIRSGPKRSSMPAVSPEGAAVDADVLADQEDALVLLHLLAHGLADRFDVGDLRRHRAGASGDSAYTPSRRRSGGGIGEARAKSTSPSSSSSISATIRRSSSCGGQPAGEQVPLEAVDRVLRLPLLEELLRHVAGVVVLGVALHAEGLRLDQRRAAAGARPLQRPRVAS